MKNKIKHALHPKTRGQKLEEAGAGLPLLQRVVVRYVLGGVVSRYSDWDLDQKVFQRTHDRIQHLIHGLTEEQMQKKILVKPIIGLEDSSRYWSVAMVLEHIVFVGEGIAEIIVQLSRGETPKIKVDIAAVKPTGKAPVVGVVANFQHYTMSILSRINADVVNKDSAKALEHPWFGDMTLRQWHWLLARHSGIHLKQIEQIVDVLRR